MLVKLIPATLVLILLTHLTCAQVAQESSETEIDFVNILCAKRENEQSRQKLLRANSHLVNDRLWWALIQRASASFNVASPKESLTIYEIAIAAARQLESTKLLGVTYYYLGRTYSGLNQLKEAIVAYETSQHFHEKAGSREELVNVLADLGLLYFIQDDYEKARSYSVRSLSLALSLGDPSASSVEPRQLGKATALATLADIYLREGNYDQSLANLQESLALYQQLGRTNPFYQTYVAGTLQTLGRVYTSSGDYHQALSRP